MTSTNEVETLRLAIENKNSMLTVQLTDTGKIDLCYPKVKFLKEFDVTHFENHSLSCLIVGGGGGGVKLQSLGKKTLKFI